MQCEIQRDLKLMKPTQSILMILVKSRENVFNKIHMVIKRC